MIETKYFIGYGWSYRIGSAWIGRYSAEHIARQYGRLAANHQRALEALAL